jgi:hypothetical protein
MALPADTAGRSVDEAAYYANIAAWVQRGGNLVLTDRALHALAPLGILEGDDVIDQDVYLPYANIEDFEHTMVAGLRANARQLVDTTLLGYGINSNEVPASMTLVTREAFEAAGGHTVATTGDYEGTTDDGTLASIGELPLGEGFVRILGGALPRATEENDHRYGVRDYAMTYTALFIMENAIQHDVAGLGEGDPPAPAPGGGSAPDGESTPMPSTGGGLALTMLGAAMLAATARLRRRPAA